jgi:hypothetical protein
MSNVRSGKAMAFSKSRKRRGKQGKGLGEMSSEPTTSLGSIVKACLSNESQNKVVERSHHLACISNGHAGGIFFQGEIAAIM